MRLSDQDKMNPKIFWGVVRAIWAEIKRSVEKVPKIWGKSVG